MKIQDVSRCRSEGLWDGETATRKENKGAKEAKERVWEVQTA